MDGNRVKRSYETTPIMSTYLLAFVVGEFDMIEKETSAGVAIRCYTPRGKSVRRCSISKSSCLAKGYYGALKNCISCHREWIGTAIFASNFNNYFFSVHFDFAESTEIVFVFRFKVNLLLMSR